MTVSASIRPALAPLTLAAVLGSAAGAAASGFTLTTLLHHSGAAPGAIALLGVLAQGAMVSALPTALLLRRLDHRRATLLILSIAYGCLLPLALVAAFAPSGPWLVLGVLTLWAMHTSMGAGCVGPANAWFRHLIPGRIQGSYLGWRSGIGLAMAAVATPIAGWLLEVGPAGRLVPALLLVMGALLAVADLLVLTRAPMPLRCQSVSAVTPPLRELFRSRGVWMPALAALLSSTGRLLVAPFFVLICFACGLGPAMTALITAASMLAGAVGLAWGGRLADRGDPRQLLALMAAGGLPVLALTTVLVGCAHVLPVHVVAAGFLVLGIAGELLAGRGAAALTKLQFALAPAGSSTSFAAQESLRASGALVLGLVTTGVGSVLVTFEAPMQAWLPGFSWPLGVMVLATAFGCLACWPLRRWLTLPQSAGPPRSALAA